MRRIPKPKLGKIHEETMRILTINVPRHYIEKIDEMVRAGITPSRSEMIRVFIRESLVRIALEEELIKQIKPETIIRKNELLVDGRIIMVRPTK